MTQLSVHTYPAKQYALNSQMSPLLQHLLFLGLLKDEEYYCGVQWGQNIQGDKLGSHPGWQNWRGSISGMLSSELLTGQHGWLCKCGGNNNKNWFCQNRKIIRTIPALQKRYLREVNCIGGGLKACANCTQSSISKRSRATAATYVQKGLLLLLAAHHPEYPFLPHLHLPSASSRRAPPFPAADKHRQGSHSSSQKNTSPSWWCREGHSRATRRSLGLQH